MSEIERKSESEILEVGEPIGEAAEEPAEQPIEEPAEESVGEPIGEPAEQPTGEPAEQPVGEPIGESIGEPVGESVEPPVKARRKFPWRWAGAAVTMLAVGTGCAFAVLAPQRTDLPGLKTAGDGRYTFAPLTLPTLAPGQAAPGTDANHGQQHVSDIRKLLLSPPEGATADRSLPGASGWVSRAATVGILDNPQASYQLRTDGWRHTAGVAWKTPDGADTKIWLLQFIDGEATDDAYSTLNSFYSVSAQGATAETLEINQATAATYVRVVKGSTATYYGQVQLYDIAFLIQYTAPVSVGVAPFEQEIDLQAELLQ
ncbi:hypothetical protein [Actinospica sp.]|uniref:hypothetical protein n=1 Tax=Actinospica sp. TaxID=1872142 RepID=UPI002C782359|nr:hypothetical protein [Actinospica sp.]HWG26537.1 hypothetical protein [Actinospica sp.]